MSTTWRADFPRGVGPIRRVNEDAISAESPAPGELAVLARMTGAPVAHNDGAIVVFDEDLTLSGFTSDGAGNYTCTQAGTYFIHASVSFALDGVTVAWGDIHGLDVMVGAVATLRQRSCTLATSNFANAGGSVPLIAGNVISVLGFTTAGNIAMQGGADNFMTSLSIIRVA